MSPIAVLKFRDPLSGTWQPLSSAGPAGPPGPAGPIDILTDVDTSTTPPADGQVLGWDQTTGQWKPVTPVAGGARYLDELLDVDVSTVPAVAGDHLSFDGVGWTAYKNAIQATAPPAPRMGQLWLVQ